MPAGAVLEALGPLVACGAERGEDGVRGGAHRDTCACAPRGVQPSRDSSHRGNGEVSCLLGALGHSLGNGQHHHVAYHASAPLWLGAAQHGRRLVLFAIGLQL